MSRTMMIGTCPDCGKSEIKLTSTGVCETCRTRQSNAKARGKTYIPYVDLSEDAKRKIDHLQQAQLMRRQQKEEMNAPKEIPAPAIPTQIENYYEVKATKNNTVTPTEVIPVYNTEKTISKLSSSTTKTTKVESPLNLNDKDKFINTLRECGCEIPENTLNEVLNVLIATDQLKDILMTIAKNDSQQAILDLEQALNVIERKLQHIWEYNGFQDEDEYKFKNFLTWRRILKSATFFWKKLYQTNTIIEMQKIWDSYTANPSEKILMAKDRIDSTMKRYQITTESISTILNTKRPFTRVFYAANEEDAYNKFVTWMADRQLHENKSKTTITELK